MCNLYHLFQSSGGNALCVIYMSYFSLHEAMPFVVKQLQILWCGKMIKILFLELIDYVDYAKDQERQKPSSSSRSKFVNLTFTLYSYQTVTSIFRQKVNI